MDKLRAVIGPAPHELAFPSLLDKLRAERARINSLLHIDLKPKKTSKKKAAAPRKGKKTLTRKEVEFISQATGVSIEDLMRG